MQYPIAFRKLINELSKLPSIGERSAEKLAAHLTMAKELDVKSLSAAIEGIITGVHLCEICFAFCEGKQCEICTNPERNGEEICVVNTPADVIALEKVGNYKGLYHVTHGLWAPSRGIGIENLRFAELKKRIDEKNVEEVIAAFESSVEGDATARALKYLLDGTGVQITRIAQGIPKGGDFDHFDAATINYALEGRNSL